MTLNPGNMVIAFAAGKVGVSGRTLGGKIGNLGKLSIMEWR